MATTTKLVTYEEWLTMPEVQDAVEEVINGEIVITPAPKLPHANVVQNVRDIVADQLDGHVYYVIVSQFALVIRRDPLTCRVPDLAVFRRSNVVVVDGHVHSAPELVAEVLSPSDTRVDIEPKLRDYESLGVPEVWVFSPEACTVEVMLLKDGRLTTVALQREGILRPTQFPEVAVDIATVWPD
jgi:Uma2 family endonuclease